jgi:hypothetical protein
MMMQPTGVQGASLRRVDLVQHPVGVDLLRQRKLHEDAVDLVVGVELLHERKHFGFGCVLQQLVLE